MRTAYYRCHPEINIWKIPEKAPFYMMRQALLHFLII